MAKYYYEKTRKLPKRKVAKLGGLFALVAGLVLFLYFFFPVISYQLFLSRAFAQGDIESPIPKRMVIKQSNLGNLLSQGVARLTSDFSDARNWYPQVHSSIDNEKKPEIESYTISIPKLKIDQATISTVDYDLSSHLVQYFGTTTPPNKGTAVIFGHSTLPQLFDPTNYKAIFATMHTIKVGDEIFVTVNDVTYRYKVFSITITEPEDTNMFTQSFDNSYLTIVTCTPPGTIWKRLIVRASLDIPS